MKFKGNAGFQVKLFSSRYNLHIRKTALISSDKKCAFFIPYEATCIIGRDKKADVVTLWSGDRKDKSYISRRHVSLSCDYFKDSFPVLRVQDLDSLNGVFVEGIRVRNKLLKDNEYLSLGSGADLDHGNVIDSLPRSEAVGGGLAECEKTNVDVKDPSLILQICWTYDAPPANASLPSSPSLRRRTLHIASGLDDMFDGDDMKPAYDHTHPGKTSNPSPNSIELPCLNFNTCVPFGTTVHVEGENNEKDKTEVGSNTNSEIEFLSQNPNEVFTTPWARDRMKGEHDDVDEIPPSLSQILPASMRDDTSVLYNGAAKRARRCSIFGPP